MKLTILYLLLIASLSGFSQKIDNDKINDYINHIENNNRGIGSVSIFSNGQEVFNRSFGQGKFQNVKFDANTKYQVGSITKMITATLIFKLIEDNKLELEDKLSNFYPEIPNSTKITIKNLLEHSSGLGNYSLKNDSIEWLTTRVAEKDIFDEIILQGNDFQPNEKVEYSNSGYYILTKIVEKKYKSNYATIVNDIIAKPLKLKNFSSSKRNIKNIFKSYFYKNKLWTESIEFDFLNTVGVGDIVSTTKDLNTFITNLFQYNILKKETVEIMKPLYDKETFGRGLMWIPFYQHRFFGHGGDTFGTHSIVAFSEKDNISFSLCINGQRFSHNDFVIGLLNIIYDLENEYPVFKDGIILKPENLDIYLGVYLSSDVLYKLVIVKEGNMLKVKGPGEAFLLECYEIDKFSYDHNSIKLEFKTFENKMILNLNGSEFVFTKE
jgi:D-alanyl-D-alanine carboxypeptidase